MTSSGLPHDELEALIAADALDGLDDGDRRELDRLRASHGPNCSECLRLEADYAEVAGRIGLLAEPVELSPHAEDALIRAARRTEAAPRLPGSTSPVRGRRAWLAPVAVAALLAIVAGVVGYALAPRSAGLRAITLRGPGAGSASLVYQPGRTDAILFATGLPDPGPGNVYELWYQPAPGAAMRPAGIFTGSAEPVRVLVGGSFELVAVTIERGPRGSPQPTSTPILSAPA